MLSAIEIARLQDSCTSRWHLQDPSVPLALENEFLHVKEHDFRNEEDHELIHKEEHDFLHKVAEQHLANFELWHEEDKARSPGASDHDIADVKHSIDRINQRRNDLAEGCDELLMRWLKDRGLPSPTAELHSETPGLIIDRLSILSLKLFHTHEEMIRTDAPPGHADRNRERFAILSSQQTDLVGSLDRLWQQVLAGERRIKLYRQLKMYNDPTLNPVVYGRK